MKSPILVALLFGAVFGNANIASAQNPMGDGKPRIFVADKGGNNIKLLVEIPEAAYHGSPHWGADGKLILINAMPRDRAYELSRIYACAIGGPFSGNVAEMGCGACARFSPDMSQIAFHVRAGNPDAIEPGIWVMRDDGADRKRLCDGTRPRWTADGKRLVFVSPRGNMLEIIGADGDGRRPLLKETYATMAGASLSPDGKHVCYISYPERAYDGVLYRAPLDGAAEPKAIYRGRIGWDPAWSPDGSQILFWLLEETGDRHLAVVDSEGQQPPKKLANQEGTHYNTDAEWSPSGNRIIFCSDRDFAKK